MQLFDTHSLIDTSRMFDKAGKIERWATEYLAGMGKRWCSRCKRVLEMESFGPNAGELGGKSRYCKPCSTDLNRIQISKRAKRVKASREKRKEELVQILGGKCGRCGYNEFISALDFHHVTYHTKKFIISDKLSRTTKESSKDMMLEEIDKCAVLCSNCHKAIAEWQDSVTWEKQAVGWRLFPKDEL